MWESVIVAFLSLVGSLTGAFLSNRKSVAIILYRLEALEDTVKKHNQVIERTHRLEEQAKSLDRRVESLERGGR